MSALPTEQNPPPKRLLLGCIADDFTGATDLASILTQAGMRVVQTIGVASDTGVASDMQGLEADAVVVALKSRTLAPALAVAQSLEALAWLQSLGAGQIYFKYCSTFDSVYTGEPRGNIGPVIDALMDALDAPFTVATPAFPANGRAVFNGHLFVGGVLLSESGMRDHPLTPMRDANLVRVLQAQCRRKVGLLSHAAVRQGPAAIRLAMSELQAQGVQVAIADATESDDLRHIGLAAHDLKLVTAASGLALGLPQNHGMKPSETGPKLPAANGLKAVVSGSCSVATQAQVAHFLGLGLPAFRINPGQVFAEEPVVQAALDWAKTAVGQYPILIYSTASPAEVQQAQALGGAQQTGQMLENVLAQIAHGLLGLGVRQLMVAGGETSGACVQALGVQSMQIGPAVAPGVPWCHVAARADTPALHMLLKSGNFGAVDVFSAGFEVLA